MTIDNTLIIYEIRQKQTSMEKTLDENRRKIARHWKKIDVR